MEHVLKFFDAAVDVGFGEATYQLYTNISVQVLVPEYMFLGVECALKHLADAIPEL